MQDCQQPQTVPTQGLGKGDGQAPSQWSPSSKPAPVEITLCASVGRAAPTRGAGAAPSFLPGRCEEGPVVIEPPLPSGGSGQKGVRIGCPKHSSLALALLWAEVKWEIVDTGKALYPPRFLPKEKVCFWVFPFSYKEYYWRQKSVLCWIWKKKNRTQLAKNNPYFP